MERPNNTVAKSHLARILLLIIAVGGCESSSSEPPTSENFLVALGSAYPDYSIREWPDSMRGYRKSPENFVGDILFGDFNSDGVTDLSAMLTRAPTENDLKLLPERHRDEIQAVELVVVCDGLVADGPDMEFHCSELSQEMIGGVYGQLDFVDWTRWIDGLVLEEDERNNSTCLKALNDRSGMKSLSLLEPIGHCNTFFYPLDSNGYGGCEYCAD
jgi:hypothetical protein